MALRIRTSYAATCALVARMMKVASTAVPRGTISSYCSSVYSSKDGQFLSRSYYWGAPRTKGRGAQVPALSAAWFHGFNTGGESNALLPRRQSYRDRDTDSFRRVGTGRGDPSSTLGRPARKGNVRVFWHAGDERVLPSRGLCRSTQISKSTSVSDPTGTFNRHSFSAPFVDCRGIFRSTFLSFRGRGDRWPSSVQRAALRVSGGNVDARAIGAAQAVGEPLARKQLQAVVASPLHSRTGSR